MTGIMPEMKVNMEAQKKIEPSEEMTLTSSLEKAILCN